MVETGGMEDAAGVDDAGGGGAAEDATATLTVLEAQSAVSVTVSVWVTVTVVSTTYTVDRVMVVSATTAALVKTVSSSSSSSHSSSSSQTELVGAAEATAKVFAGGGVVTATGVGAQVGVQLLETGAGVQLLDGVQLEAGAEDTATATFTVVLDASGVEDQVDDSVHDSEDEDDTAAAQFCGQLKPLVFAHPSWARVPSISITRRLSSRRVIKVEPQSHLGLDPCLETVHIDNSVGVHREEQSTRRVGTRTSQVVVSSSKRSIDIVTSERFAYAQRQVDA